MKTPMTQNFIDHWLDINSSWYHSELNLTEISKERYNELYNIKIRSERFYQQAHFFDAYDNLAHPLLKVHIIEDYRTATNYNGGYDWCYVFIFKYKGKFYQFSDIDGI